MSASHSSREGYAPYGEHRTWYRITGNPASDKTPLVIAHGGPGCTHDYLLAFQDLADDGRLVVHYDQLGNGRSSHPPKAPADFWTVELFLEELDNLLSHLGISDSYHLLGHSWGGMLAAEHAVRQPAGLRALVIVSSPSSFPVWVAEALRLRAHLPAPERLALEQHEISGRFDHPDYLKATEAFYRRHVCRLPEWPDEVKHTFAAIESDPTVYHTMNGPTEFHVIGSLKDWQIDDRLNNVLAPTLIISGHYDEATQACIAPYAALIPGARAVVMPNSSHMCHLEERGPTMHAVASFLAQHES